MIEGLQDILVFLEQLSSATPLVFMMFYSLLSSSANWHLIKAYFQLSKKAGRLRSLVVGYSVASGKTVDQAESSVNKILDE